MHKPPNDLNEYNALYMRNSGAFGRGLTGTGQSLACPFCCAPGFIKATLLGREDGIGDAPGFQEALRNGATCKECGRSAKCLFMETHGGAGKSFSLVQTGGDDPPAWLSAVLPIPRI